MNTIDKYYIMPDNVVYCILITEEETKYIKIFFEKNIISSFITWVCRFSELYITNEHIKFSNPEHRVSYKEISLIELTNVLLQVS